MEEPAFLDPIAASASFPSSPTVSFCPPWRKATMSSRAWSTRTFSFDSVSVSASAMRLSIRACMSSLLPSDTASSTSFQQLARHRRVEARAAFMQDDLQGLLHDHAEVRVARALGRWRARPTRRRAVARSFASIDFVRSTRTARNSRRPRRDRRKSAHRLEGSRNASRTGLEEGRFPHAS